MASLAVVAAILDESTCQNISLIRLCVRGLDLSCRSATGDSHGAAIPAALVGAGSGLSGGCDRERRTSERDSGTIPRRRFYGDCLGVVCRDM